MAGLADAVASRSVAAVDLLPLTGVSSFIARTERCCAATRQDTFVHYIISLILRKVYSGSEHELFLFCSLDGYSDL